MTADDKPTLQRTLRMTDAELLAFRDIVLDRLDLDMARKMFPTASSDEVLLASMHKARYELTHFPDHKRLESRKWLEDHGMGRWRNQGWPLTGLPR